MKFNESFGLREICGENVLIATGIENIDFNKLIKLNETAADLFQHFLGQDFSIEEAVSYLCEQYTGADRVQVEKDLQKLFEDFRTNGIIA